MAEPAQKSRARKLALGAFGLAVTLLAMMPVAAQASTPTDLVSPDEADQTIQVWIRLDSDKSNLPNVGVNVSGEGIDEDVVTGEDGKVIIGLEEPGDYTITIDESTLPPEAGFPNKNPREISVSAGQKGAPGIFLISPENQEMGATPAPSTGNGNGQSAGPGFWTLFWPKVVTGLIFGLLLALAAIGLSLIFGTTGLSNFAHAEMVTFGAVMTLVFGVFLKFPMFVAIPIAVLLSAAFGLTLDAAIWRPLRRKGIGLTQLLIVSIGLSLALRYTFQFFIGGSIFQLPGSSDKKIQIFGPISLTITDMVSMGVSILVLAAVAWWLVNTRIGKATRAISDNPSLAAASGINVDGVVRIVWVVAAALAGLAGVLWAYFIPGIKWDMGAQILLLVFAAITLGGLGTAFGALVGSLIVGLLVEVSTLWIPSDLKYLGALVILIVVLLVRPQGILGRKERIG